MPASVWFSFDGRAYEAGLEPLAKGYPADLSLDTDSLVSERGNAAAASTMVCAWRIPSWIEPRITVLDEVGTVCPSERSQRYRKSLAGTAGTCVYWK